MENYYEILEISPKASKEIIDKAYKTLAKRYHPDANSVENKQWAEEKFKKINEAYEIISNKEKREEYDRELERQRNQQLIQSEDLKNRYEKLYEENQILKNQLANLTTNITYENNNREEEIYNNMQNQINQKVTQSVNQAYYDAYIQRMKDYGYRIYHKKTLKEKMKDLLTIIIVIMIVMIILFILWQIPAFRNYIETNKIFQAFKNAFFK